MWFDILKVEITEEEIQALMKKYNLNREEAVRKLIRKKGKKTRTAIGDWAKYVRKQAGVITSTSANTSDLFNVRYSKKKEDEEDGQEDEKKTNNKKK